MKFYRTLQPFKVITFDLDDTLYDNSTVIRLAEQRCIDTLRDSSALTQLGADLWFEWKARIARRHPRLSEDVTAWRLETMRALLTAHGKSAVEIKRISEQTIQEFLQWRHKITIPPQNMALLTQLSRHYKLAAISNGNVDPARIGLTQFALILRGGLQGRAKPHADLFRQTAAYFALPPQQILHVGDSLLTDIQGAMQAGCQSVWLNLSGDRINAFAECRLLPSVEIHDLTELCAITRS
ncbi:HAD-IA family hydrolase [Necropsobacter massiliensis]|uniref:HAD-IA family hydrolase n=1 Tax=Necropsobacter massiliensis TaxID=1400001 RepID=UPI000595CE95|nr:HAD-IA family hydrolase [Necropsobacter massiliensis]